MTLSKHKVNSSIHNEIRKHLSTDLKDTFSYDSLDVDKLVSDTDPQLWNFITLITRSISEHKGLYQPKTSSPGTQTLDTKMYIIYRAIL